MRGFVNAAVCRAQADWLIGMNATRAYTTRYFKRLVVGRVQTPTLAMLTERKKIEHFKEEAYYKVSVRWEAVVTSSIPLEMEAEELENFVMGQKHWLLKGKKRAEKTFPPKLYRLTGLQREANRFWIHCPEDIGYAAGAV